MAAVKTFLCPVEKRQGWYPSLHTVSLSLPGRSRGSALIGTDPVWQPVCIFTVWADDFAELDTHPDAVDFGGVPQKRLSEYLLHLDGLPFNTATKRSAIIDRALAIGLTRSLDGLSTGAVLREFLKHLEPAATDDMFERVVADRKETITDNFDRASMGLGWAASLGTLWVTNGDITARPVDAYVRSTVKRSEASFPDDQYAQCDTEYSVFGVENSQGGVMCRCSSSANFYSAKFGGVNYLELNKNSTADYLADAAITLASNTMATIKITATGTTITVHVAGTQRISHSDSTHPSGVPGMWAFTGAPESVEDHDNFECTDAVAAAGNDARIVFRQS